MNMIKNFYKQPLVLQAIMLTLFLFNLPLATSYGTNMQPEGIHILANDPQWRRLLHYGRSFWGVQNSRVDRRDFFLAPSGKQNPLAELEATVAAFRLGKPLVGPLAQEPACAFPARFNFIASRLPGPWAPSNCQAFNNWHRRLSPGSVTLVFSSAFPNSPASMFGHTFLRINARQPSSLALTNNDLLGYGVSFGALVDDWNPLTYALRGLGGGFPGIFTVDPYYMKVKEYGFMENRDLWEYDLALSPAETEQLVAHLWELLVHASFDYFFLDENCSFQLLGLLEAAVPRWNLLEKTGYIVLPAATVRIITDKQEIVSAVRFRPSHRRQLLSRLAILDYGEKQNFKSLISETPIPPKGPMPLAALDATIAYLNFKKASKNGLLEQEDIKRIDHILIARSSRAPSPPLDIPPARNRPDDGHGPASLGLGYVGGQNIQKMNVQTRLGYHSLLDDDRGYEPHFQFIYAAAKLSFDLKTQIIDLEQFDFIEAQSVQPYTAFDPHFSWRLRLGLDRLSDEFCIDCRRFNFEGSYGITATVLDERVMFSALPGLILEASEQVSGFLLGGPMMMVTALMRTSEQTKALYTLRKSRLFNTAHGLSSQQTSSRFELAVNSRWSQSGIFYEKLKSSSRYGISFNIYR